MAAVKKDKPEKKEKQEPITTYLPMAFWSQIVDTLDNKSKSISEVYGFGKIDLSLIIYNGKVKDVIFNDEIRIRPDWDKPPLNNS
jgi:hypothetical protein